MVIKKLKSPLINEIKRYDYMIYHAFCPIKYGFKERVVFYLTHFILKINRKEFEYIPIELYRNHNFLKFIKNIYKKFSYSQYEIIAIKTYCSIRYRIFERLNGFLIV